MGCFSPNNKKSSRAHPDLIENFSYKKSCADWAENFHLKLGKRQSPIDIPLNYLRNDSECPIIMRLKFNPYPLFIMAQYTDTTFSTSLTNEPLAEIKLFQKNDPTKFQVYQSFTLHFHSQSEHKFSGVQYDAEMHIVFKKMPPSTLAQNLCVIGILFKANDDFFNEEDRKPLNSFQPDYPYQNLTNIDMSYIFKNNLMRNPRFYHYIGSLTTPPCTETVNWFVHPRVFSVKTEDLKPFFEKWRDNTEFCPTGKGNSRPVLPLNQRMVYEITAKPF